jgi:TRAP-type C4-dicarboxylate transport system substrate-binding protein
MKVVTEVDRDKFAAAMAAAKPEFDKRFGSELIEKIKQFK